MAVDKLVVLKAIEEKFKGKSLTKNFKENLATKWAEKIETDSDIDGYIDDREDVILEANAEADRRAIAAAKTAKEKTVEKQPEEQPDLTEVPEWAKALIKSNTELNEKLAGFEASNKAKSIKEKFDSDERVKDIPLFIRSAFTPKSDDDFEDKISELTAGYKDFAEKHKLQDYKSDTPKSGDRSNPIEVKKISAEDAKKIVENMN